VLASVPLIDGHNDLAWVARENFGYDLDHLAFDQRRDDTHTDLPRLRQGGLGAQFWSVYVPATLPGPEAVRATLEQIDFVHRLVARYPADLMLADSAEAVRAAFAGGRIGCLLGAEGGHSIDGSLAVLRMFRALGVRYLTLTHFKNVGWADAATDVASTPAGLTDFGREVVREMNRIGMLVDLSHVSAATMRTALETSSAPVIFSHSSAAGLVEHPRNVPDEVLARLPGTGGVCMVSFVDEFVSVPCYEWGRGMAEWMEGEGLDPFDSDDRAKAVGVYSQSHPRPVATVADAADHVERVREVAGVRHVGVGGDYDGCDSLPEGLGDVSGYPRLFAELLDRGWSAEECRLLAGENLLRVLAAADEVAGAGAAP
jgi:membrane dipeptidase